MFFPDVENLKSLQPNFRRASSNQIFLLNMKPKFKNSYRPKSAAAASLLLSVCPFAWVSAVPPILNAPEISITPPTSFRAVAGTTLAPLNFTTKNLNAVSDTAFGLSLSTGSVGSINNLKQPDASIIPGGIRTTNTPFTNVSLLAGNTGTIFATPSITGVLAGDTRTFGLTATNATWNAPVTANTSIDVVANRLLTGSVTIDKGRHIAGLQSIGSITLNGGALTGTEATNISIKSGGYAQLANGLRLTSSTDFTFNGANQTHDLQISYNRPEGAYNITTTLPGASIGSGDTAVSYTDASGNHRQDFGGSWTTSANYGNILGASQTFTEQDRAGWATLQGGNTVWRRPATTGQNVTDYIYKQEVASTAQPSIPTTRASQSGLNTNWELSRGTGVLVSERVNPLISGEVIQGSNLDLSGISLNITGTAVSDRTINQGLVNLGRRMVNAPVETINRTDSLTLGSSGSDDQKTRLDLSGFTLSANGVVATHTATTQFKSGSEVANVQVTGNFQLDTTVNGRVDRIVNAGSNIVGENLTGANTQTSLEIGYTWNNVLNNTITAQNLLIIEPASASGLRSYDPAWGRTFGTQTHTAIGRSGGDVNLSQSYSAGLTDLGYRTVSATAEGLFGEVPSGSATFNAKLATVANAVYSVAHTGDQDGTLTTGNTITVSDTGNSVYQNNVQISKVEISGGEKLDYRVIYGGGDSILGHSQNRTFTIDYKGNAVAPLAGELGRVSNAELTLGLAERVNYSGIATAVGNYSIHDATTVGSLGSQIFLLQTRFDAPASAQATSTAPQGSNFANNGLNLNNTVGNTSTRFAGKFTGLELIDSATLLSAKTVQVEFVKLDAASPAVVAALENSESNAASLVGIYHGAGAKFTSDIVELSGLNGVLQVLQVGYDDTLAGSEEGAQLLWQYNYDVLGTPKVAWINAVLGNTNITLLDLVAGTLNVNGGSQTIENYLSGTRFEGSYANYLATNSLTDPALGAWGLDTENNKVWSVIDHNSSFAAAVPEPGAVTLVLLASGGLLFRRRKA